MLLALEFQLSVCQRANQWVIFLYLLDEDTSLLVTIPSGVALCVQAWKIWRATGDVQRKMIGQAKRAHIAIAPHFFCETPNRVASSLEEDCVPRAQICPVGERGSRDGHRRV